MALYSSGKRIMLGNKSSILRQIFVSCLFVASAFYVKEMPAFVFWPGVLFFGGLGLFFLLRLVNLNNIFERFIQYSITVDKKMLYKEFQQQVEYHGIFTYSVDGFCVHWRKKTDSYKWADIDTVFGYRVDRFATCDIYRDIFTDKGNITFNEDTQGWLVFIKKLGENIPLPANDWENEILNCEPGTNITLLFDKKGRTLEQASKQCYKK